MAEAEHPDGILACPKCGIRYRAPGAALGRADATYRCARCQHVFSLGTTAAPEGPPAFDFDLDDEPTLDRAPPPRTATGLDTPAFVGAASQTDGADLELPPEPAFTTSGHRSSDAGDPAMASPPNLSFLGLGARFEALVLVVFGAIGLYLVAYPDRALEILTRIPLLESTLGTSEQLLDQIYLADVRGVHERLKGNRHALVIAGRVINDSTRPVGAIQVEGRLYDEEEEIARKTVFAGTEASRRLVREWTPVEIEMFEKITPPRRYKLAPGAADKFLIIFQDVPATLSEFDCRVVTAQPAAGSS